MELFKSIVNKVRGVRLANESNNIEKSDEVVENNNFIVFNAVDIKNKVAIIYYKIKEIKINGKSILVLAENFEQKVDEYFLDVIDKKITKDKCIFNLEHLNKKTYIEDNCNCPLNGFPVGILTVLLNPTNEEIGKNIENLKKELSEHFTETSNNFVEVLKN